MINNLILENAITAAIVAGRKILEIYRQPDFEIEIKNDNSPLTKADKAAHEIIVKLLSGKFPVLSEEGKDIPWQTRKSWNTFWLVDPLDGTKEFIKRNGEFTVNIALIEKGDPILGVIFVPVLNELYYADHNGSYKVMVEHDGTTDFENMVKSSVKLPFENRGDEFYVVVGSRSHLNLETEEYIKNIDTKGKILKMVTKGSSLKLCLVASGEADIYPRLGPTMEWDIAAGHAIARFAGCTITQPSGEPVCYNKKDLLNPWFVVK